MHKTDQHEAQDNYIFQMQLQSCQYRYVIYNLAGTQTFSLYHNSPVSSPATQRSPRLGGAGRGGRREAGGGASHRCLLLSGNWGKSCGPLSHPSMAPHCPVIHSFYKHLLSTYYVLGTVLDAMDSGEQD